MYLTVRFGDCHLVFQTDRGGKEAVMFAVTSLFQFADKNNGCGQRAKHPNVVVFAWKMYFTAHKSSLLTYQEVKKSWYLLYFTSIRYVSLDK